MSTARNASGPLKQAAGPRTDEAQHRQYLLGAGRLILRAVLALAAIAVLASPFALSFYLHDRAQWLHDRAQWIGPQANTAPARFPLKELSQFRQASLGATHAAGTEPIILTYHNVAWNSRSKYVVTPAEFEDQMAMLKAAGYHTLTAQQLVDYAHGGPVPSPSVALTFDDGTMGLWTYADKILKRYHFHGISFLITSRVGTHHPYYLTWQEIRLMSASGRWDFESHTNHLHQKEQVSVAGRLGDPLTHQIWLASQNRLESMREFSLRVRNDLQHSITDITEHQLPRPRLFAYPFSDSGDASSHTAAGYANALIHSLFVMAMTDSIIPPVPLSRREAVGGTVSRLEVTSADTAVTLFSRMKETSSLPVADMRSLRDHLRWDQTGKNASISVAGRNITVTRKRAKWAYAAYSPGATADWDNYNISVSITKLNNQANPSATISVRLGSKSQVNVSVSDHYLAIRVGSVQNRTPVLTRDLPDSTAHRVAIQVLARSTVVSVDGRVVMKKPAVPGPSSTGGFALSSSRPNPGRPFASFSGITVSRVHS